MVKGVNMWKQVKGYEGVYSVNENGTIKREEHKEKNKNGYMRIKERVCSQCKSYHGYMRVTLSKGGKPKTHYVHRIVYEAFNGKIPEGYEINHIDEDKCNNSISNLEICTHIQNSNYGTRNERISKNNRWSKV